METKKERARGEGVVAETGGMGAEIGTLERGATVARGKEERGEADHERGDTGRKIGGRGGAGQGIGGTGLEKEGAGREIKSGGREADQEIGGTENNTEVVTGEDETTGIRLVVDSWTEAAVFLDVLLFGHVL